MVDHVTWLTGSACARTVRYGTGRAQANYMSVTTGGAEPSKQIEWSSNTCLPRINGTPLQVCSDQRGAHARLLSQATCAVSVSAHEQLHPSLWNFKAPENPSLRGKAPGSVRSTARLKVPCS